MDNSSYLILGAGGQIGLALQARYPDAKIAGLDDLDITDAAAMTSYDWSGVRVILNAAAYTNVDGAETSEGRLSAWKVNATAVANLTAIAIMHDLTIVHISSDYVFDGTQENHTELEPYSPLGVYGQSKAAGDIAVSLSPKYYTLRTTWVIGEGKNFVRTMIGLGHKGIAPTVVADQIGRLAFADEIARAIAHLLDTNAPYGTYNVTNGGEPASWAAITRDIFSAANYDLTVTDTSTAQYFADKPNIAPRPLNSVMDLSKLQSTGFRPVDWRDDLKAYIHKELA